MVDTFVLGKILALATLSTLLAFAWTPLLTHFLYRYKMGKSIRSAVNAPMFAKMHAKKAGVPDDGRIAHVGNASCDRMYFYGIHVLAPQSVLGELNFLRGRKRGCRLLHLLQRVCLVWPTTFERAWYWCGGWWHSYSSSIAPLHGNRRNWRMVVLCKVGLELHSYSVCG